MAREGRRSLYILHLAKVNTHVIFAEEVPLSGIHVAYQRMDSGDSTRIDFCQPLQDLLG
jgi:hypothetical protein